ncbi:MAG: mnmA [Acidimicrobiales bacterium]|nr:mnmA [Acidimicrobiales bacterium]
MSGRRERDGNDRGLGASAASERLRVFVAMSGGVDSSVAAALLLEAGHDVTGVTLKLWGGESDTGCCSVSDVDDARRVADHLGIDHHTFNFGDDFTAHVVEPYVEQHAAGRTPNPCVECNRHVKFDRLFARAEVLGFDAVATGHHARIVTDTGGRRRIARGVDRAKDQSYVVHMLGQAQLARLLLPVGDLTKDEVRARARALGLRTAGKPDSQDVCFITSAQGRAAFLGARIPLRPGRVVDQSGAEVGRVPAVELVTIGQRKGLGLAGGGAPRFAIDVDVPAATVTVGSAGDLLAAEVRVGALAWADGPMAGDLLVQTSAHGVPHAATVAVDPADRTVVVVRWSDPARRVAPGQSVVFYDGDEVVGGGSAQA